MYMYCSVTAELCGAVSYELFPLGLNQSVSLVCRAKECKAAYSHAQGLALFGSKIKLTPMNTDGE